MTRNRVIPYNPKLRQFARDLRNISTLSEVLLWKQLKGKALGFEFHRQVPVDEFIYSSHNGFRIKSEIKLYPPKQIGGQASITATLPTGRQASFGFFQTKNQTGFSIVDFYCRELMLAIEIDGSSHSNKHDYDMSRQTKLQDFGVEFIRFSDLDVKKNMEGVLGKLRSNIDEMVKTSPSLSTPVSGGQASNEENIPLAPFKGGTV